MDWYAKVDRLRLLRKLLLEYKLDLLDSAYLGFENSRLVDCVDEVDDDIKEGISIAKQLAAGMRR